MNCSGASFALGFLRPRELLTHLLLVMFGTHSVRYESKYGFVYSVFFSLRAPPEEDRARRRWHRGVYREWQRGFGFLNTRLLALVSFFCSRLLWLVRARDDMDFPK